MYEFWHDHVKLKYGEKAKLCYMNTVSLYTQKHIILKKILQETLELDLILQIMN